MKFLSWVIGVPVAIIAIVFAVINRHDVMVDLWPLPWDVQLPVYLLSLGSLAIGLVVGGFLVWVAAGHDRGRARSEGRRANALEFQVEQLREENKTLGTAQDTKALPNKRTS